MVGGVFWTSPPFLCGTFPHKHHAPHALLAVAHTGRLMATPPRKARGGRIQAQNKTKLAGVFFFFFFFRPSHCTFFFAFPFALQTLHKPATSTKRDTREKCSC